VRELSCSVVFSSFTSEEMEVPLIDRIFGQGGVGAEATLCVARVGDGPVHSLPPRPWA